jgi:hypothetical protein
MGSSTPMPDPVEPHVIWWGCTITNPTFEQWKDGKLRFDAYVRSQSNTGGVE